MTNGERAMIRKALRAANAAGFRARSVFDGEVHVRGLDPNHMLEKEVIEACESVDDSFIHFYSSAANKRAWARVILGNDPSGEEVIADNSVVPGFAEAMDSVIGA